MTVYEEQTTRIEEDALGEKEIPSEAYYGVQTVRAAENFSITGYAIEKELINSLAMVKKASALANMETNMLPRSIGDVIVTAANEIIAGHWHGQFIVDPIQGGAGTSINMNMNEVLANRALELSGKEKGNYSYISPNSHVNASQSTNDVFPTAMHIALLQSAEILLDSMKEMHGAFLEKANEFDHIVKIGRTHLQDAVPIRLGQEFKAYSCVIKRDITRIQQASLHLNEVNIGATAVGTGLNANQEYINLVINHLNEISGFPLIIPYNMVDATQNTDVYTSLSSTLKVCMINLSKIANDLRLMASGPKAGLAEITLPARQPGSSIMPGKVNPVIPEVINQIAFQVIGNDQTISLASEAGQLELNVMEPVMILNLLQSIKMMTNGFNTFTQNCVKGIKANEQIVDNYVTKSIGLITAINPYLGYEEASLIAYEALMTDQSVRDLCIKKGKLSEEELDIILNPYEMTNTGIAGWDILNKSKSI